MKNFIPSSQRNLQVDKNGMWAGNISLFILFLFICTNAWAQGTWSTLTNLAPFSNDGVLIAMPDGTIFCKTANGGGVGRTFTKLTPAANGSYQNGTWSSVTNMIHDRKYFSAQMLKIGRLYVAGGAQGGGATAGEVYNPVTNAWTSTGSPGVILGNALSEILDNGKILQAATTGLTTSHSCKLYDPLTNTYSNASSTLGIHHEATWHKLADGSILMVDKMINQTPINTERYFPATNTWVIDAQIPNELWSDFGGKLGSSVMLPDGRILFIGGQHNTAIYTPSGSSAPGSWAAGPTIPLSFGQPDGPIVIARDGVVLMAVSPDPTSVNSHLTPTKFYEFNYVTNTLTQINAPNGSATLVSNSCNDIHFVNLPNGQILCGIEGSAQYYLYSAAGTTLSTLKPTITDISSFCNDYRLYGTGLNGKSLGSGYGNEWQNSTNFPIVRMTASGLTHYCRTLNWNSTLMNRTGIDSVTFELPANLPNGSYSATVITNGVSSNATSFTTYPQFSGVSTAFTHCSGELFSFIPAFDRNCVTATWTRPIVSGISNAAITTPQTGNINEILHNTTTSAKTVNYIWILSNQGYADTVNISVTVNPKPIVSVSPSSFCISGSNVTLTASGATSYVWTPGTTGASQVVNPLQYTQYSVVGTNTLGCKDTAFSIAHALPSVSASALDSDLCPGQVTTLNAQATAYSKDSLSTTLSTNTNSNSNIFNIHATHAITIQSLKMQINNLGGTIACQVWFKPGGYGNANVTSSSGWTQIGSNINVQGAGAGSLTTIPLPSSLTIPSGQTYGIVVSCNALSSSLISSSLPGTIYNSNFDLDISVGHGGSVVLGGAFNFTLSQYVWSGEIVYTRDGTISNYSWTPSSTLTNANTSSPIANPTVSTIYTVTVTASNLCSNTATVLVNRLNNPILTSINALPSSICEKDSAILSASSNTPLSSYQWQPVNLISGSNIQSSVTVVPAVTSTFTLTATDIFGCSVTGTTIVQVNKLPSATESVTPLVSCPGDSALLTLTPILASTSVLDSLQSTASSNGASQGKVFNLIATKNLEIEKFKLELASTVTQLEVWYKPGGYGNTAFTGTAGWTQVPLIGAVNSAGTGNFTTIILSTSIQIAAGQTMGIMLAANGGIFSAVTGGTAGAVFSSNADLSVTRGHTGSGIGAYAMNGAIAVQRGEIIYSELNSIISSIWTPSTGLQTNQGISNKAAPATSTVYTVTLSDLNGCSNVLTIPVRRYTQLTGTASASPNTLCSGNPVTLNYDTPSGNQCLGVPHNGFSGNYAPTSWTLSLTNALGGNVNTSLAPNQITIQGGSGNSEGFTQYSVTIPCSGIISFNWETTNTGSSSQFDYPMYAVNGGAKFILPGYLVGEGFPVAQNGEFNLFVTAGSTFSLIMRNAVSFATGSVTITNFKAPTTSIISQFINWYTLPTGGTLIGNTIPANHTPTSSGSKTFYAEITTAPGGCLNPNRLATNTVVVNPGITVTAGSIVNPLCEGASTTLTATGGLSYVWMPGNLTGASIIVSPSATTVYTVTGTSANGCTSSTTLLLVVHPKPAITGGANPGITCPGGSVSLSCTTPNVTVQWMPGNLTGSSVIVNPLVQTMYTITVTNSQGCTNSNTFVILMHSTPNLSITANPSASVCSGSAVTLTANGALSYTWQPGNLNGANIITATANTYTVTGTNSNGCTASATKTVIINSIPIVNASSSLSSTCAFQTINLMASGNANSYTWNPGNLNGASVSVSPGVTTTYTVTGSSVEGCTSTSIVTITVNPNPVITSGSANPGIVCPGAQVTLSATSNGSITWQPGNLSGSPVIVQPVASTIYTITATSASGCTFSQTFLVLTHPTPNSTITASPSSEICLGSSVTLTATGATGYSWQPGNLSGSLISVSPTATTIYTLTASNAQGCTSTSTTNIIVHNPNISLSTSSTSLCSGSSATLSAQGASTYLWTPGNLTGNSISVSPTVSTNYTVVGTDQQGCLGSSSIFIQVDPIPQFVTNTATPMIVCPGGSSLLLSVADIPIQHFTVQPGNINSGGSVMLNPTSATTYTVTATSTQGCTNSATMTIAMHELSATALLGNICNGNSNILNASGAQSYAWQPGGATSATISVSPTATTIYTVTGTTSSGCTLSKTVTVLVSQTCLGVKNIRVFLEGYYAGNEQMQPVLFNQGVSGVNTLQCDTITVELRQPNPPYNLVKSKKVMLNTDGSAFINFGTTGLYYLVVKHRNSIEVWSEDLVPIAVTPTLYDFSISDTTVFGNNQLEVENGVWAIYSGDINQDLVIDAFDYLLQEPDITLGAFGYLDTDLNGDGTVDSFDYIILDNNLIQGIGVITP